MLEQGHQWLREAQEAAEFAAPGVQTQVHLFTGDPRATLLAEAQHARELVVGSRGLGGFTRMLLGSTSAAVTQHASCPVVVVVHGQGDTAGPVVVGLDGSTASEHALGYAFQAAARAGAALCAVHAWQDFGALHSPIAPAKAVPVKQIEAEAYRMLAEQLASWQEKYPHVVVERQVTAGTQLAVADDLSAIFVTARIDDTAIGDVQLGQQVDITADAYPDITLTGYVREIKGSSAGALCRPQDNTTGRFQKLTQWIPVKITIADPTNLNLVPAMNVTVKIHRTNRRLRSSARSMKPLYSPLEQARTYARAAARGQFLEDYRYAPGSKAGGSSPGIISRPLIACGTKRIQCPR